MRSRCGSHLRLLSIPEASQLEQNAPKAPRAATSIAGLTRLGSDCLARHTFLSQLFS